MNILEVEDIVKGLPDARLYEEALTPSGQLPQFLLVSEVQRRMDMRKRFANTEPQPVGSVYDKIMREASMQVPQEQQQPQMQPQMQQMAGGGIVQLQAGGVTPYGSDHFQIVVNGKIIDIPMGNYTLQDDAIEAYALQHGRADINPANEGFDPTWGQSEPDGIAALDVPLLDVPRETPKTAVHPDKVDAYTDAEGLMAQASLAQKLLTPGGIVGLDSSQQYLDQLMSLAGQEPDMPPDFSELIAEQRHDAYNAALIQLGAGISSGNMPAAISKAGEAAMEGKKATRELQMQSRLLKYRAGEEAKTRKADIYKDILKINAELANNKGASAHSVQVDEDGNIVVITRNPDEKGNYIVDTKRKASRNTRLVTNADGSVQVVSTYGRSAGEAKTIIPPQEGLSKIESGAHAKETGQQRGELEYIPDIAAAKRQEERIAAAPEKITEAERSKETSMDVIEDISDAFDKVGVFTTGITGKLLSFKPGSDRKDLEGLYTTIKSNLGLETLSRMKQETRTGASGMGSLNEAELESIQSAKAALDADLSPPQQIRNLNKLKRHLERQRILADAIIKYNNDLLPEDEAMNIVRREWLNIDKAYEETTDKPKTAAEAEGTKVWDNKGNPYIIKNGKPVPANE